LFIDSIKDRYKLSFQDIEQLSIIDRDLKMWDKGSVEDLWDDSLTTKYEGKRLKKELISRVKIAYENIKNTPIDYNKSEDIKTTRDKIKIQNHKKDSLGFGMCPVASENTRCCNLLTLDAVESCGYDCSYCSIQSFYNSNQVTFDSSFKEKLDSISLDKNEIYHVGTGQSSDSLMWGNKFNILDHLVEFATKNPNVILELKTKSDNISYFIDNRDKIPKNMLFTWSLNPQIVIDNEEHLTASLKERLDAAKMLHELGFLVGFHFHPIIYIEDFEKHYGELFSKLKSMFDPKGVVLVSLGTLTFIKPVIKKIRSRDFKSRVLQIPLSNASGKLSYPFETKKKIFKFAYDSLKEWHKEVFFYMCMEDHKLWSEVFGYEYATNNQMEDMMKMSYINKIKNRPSKKSNL
jgi:spore photoproduct lyase